MLPDEQIERALAKIAKLDGAVSQDVDDLIALGADYKRLKAQLASIKDHADEYLVNEDLTAEKAMRLIGRKLS